MKHKLIENNIVILSKQTIDAFLREKNPAEVLALYCFYYYVAKWQDTNQPRATISFCANGLRWGLTKTRAVKKQLLDIGLIEDVRHTNENTKKVEGWYIRIKYLWKEENHPHENREGGVIHSHPHNLPHGGLSHRVEKTVPNALSVNNINALSVNNKMLKASSQKKCKICGKLTSDYREGTGGVECLEH